MQQMYQQQPADQFNNKPQHQPQDYIIVDNVKLRPYPPQADLVVMEDANGVREEGAIYIDLT